jgi:hypothetical protein
MNTISTLTHVPYSYVRNHLRNRQPEGVPVLDTMIRDNKPSLNVQRKDPELLEHYIFCARKKFNETLKKIHKNTI